MKAKGLGKLYDRLTPEERFRLDVEAMARGDDKESRRLVDTCPRKSYTTTEWGFCGRWHGAKELALYVSLDLTQRITRLQMLEVFREALAPFENEVEGAQMASELLERLTKTLLEDVCTLWEGYRLFSSSRLSLKPEKLLSVSYGALCEPVEKMKSLARELEVEADKEKAAEYEAVLSECWERQRSEFERLSKS